MIRPTGRPRRSRRTLVTRGGLLSTPSIVVSLSLPLRGDSRGMGLSDTLLLSSPGSTACQFRRGIMVATSTGWIRGASPQADLSLITVQPPFEGVKGIQYATTPRSGSLSLGIVGYPGWVPSIVTRRCLIPAHAVHIRDKLHGEYMFEHFEQKVTYNLADANGMLTYRIGTSSGEEKAPTKLQRLTGHPAGKLDSYGGNSGSPVLRGRDLVSIGVHTYGGAINKASVIGPSGNILSNYTRALTASESTTESAGQISFVNVSPPGAETESGIVAVGPNGEKMESGELTDGDAQPSGGQEESGEESDIDRFDRTLKMAVALQGRPPTEAAVAAGMPPVLGPTAAPQGSLSAVALGAAGRIGSAVLNRQPVSLDGVVELAILQEAAWAAVQKLSTEVNQRHEVFLNMARIIGGLHRKVEDASFIVRQTSNTALGGIVAHHYTRGLSGRPPRERTVEAAPGAESGAMTDEATRAMVEGLLQSGESAGKEESDQEFSLTSLTNLVKNGLNIAKPLLGPALDIGLPYLVNKLSKTRTESVQEAADAEDARPFNDALTARVKLTTASLDALLEIPTEVAKEEGIWGDMLKAINQIAPMVLKVAPSVINAVTHLSPIPLATAEAINLPDEEDAADKRKPESLEEFLTMFDHWRSG